MIEKAISSLYENGLIFSNLRLDLYAVTDSIAKYINAKYYNDDPNINKELKKMETTHAFFCE